MFLPLDKSKIPNLANLDPEVMKRIAQQDQDNKYGVPYMVGTTGIGYNVAKLKERFGGSTEIANSWDLVFKPENIAKMKDCGVTLLDTPADMIPIALHYLGEDPHSHDPATIQKAAELVLTDLRAGAIGRVTLETPPEFEAWLAVGEAQEAERKARKAERDRERKNKGRGRG